PQPTKVRVIESKEQQIVPFGVRLFYLRFKIRPRFSKKRVIIGGSPFGRAPHPPMMRFKSKIQDYLL
ncbi:MAG: hypothetical protein IKK35_02565, partial [Rikenellaceae bacterium]|nr:hypothetical protein [Rikenellaceae bacterium]